MVLEQDLIRDKLLFDQILAEAAVFVGWDVVCDCVDYFGKLYGAPIPPAKRVIVVTALASVIRGRPLWREAQ
jgi:hypothetical protein